LNKIFYFIFGFQARNIYFIFDTVSDAAVPRLGAAVPQIRRQS
jgi:hypothetical protein